MQNIFHLLRILLLKYLYHCDLYTSLCSLLLSLQTPNNDHKNIQATSKGSDQTARMRKLIRGFAGRTYYIV